ncbi:ABC transporter substrate-binding protein [Frigidibacter sp. MR17.24]|uniref:ABC transporter substrate-binding protein n=1 Tax=Frigidibacter sp. MR17.24 TaxID=3127345 RepID=UPI003012B133
MTKILSQSLRNRLLAGAASVALATAAVFGVTTGAASATEMVWADTLPSGLDPHVVFDVPMQMYMLNVYDNLYRYQGNPPVLEPWLATGHEVSDDGLTWKFKLREGVKFHDGSDLTAEDVVYSFQRVLGLKRGPASAFLTYLKPENVTAPDPLTVQFKLDTPYAPFLSAMPLVSILNADVVKSHEVNGDWGSAWLSSNEAGSGAYTFDAATYVPQDTVDMARFADHFRGWADNAAPIDTVHARFIKENSTRILALLNGEVQATDSYLPSDQVERVESAEGTHVATDESMRVMVIRMNNAKPPFDNANFRRCLSYAFNYDGFIDVIMQGHAKRNPGPIPATLWGSPADLKGYTYDLDKAKAACDLAKSEGAPIDRKVEIHTQSELDLTLQAAQVLQAEAMGLGLNIEIVPDTWANLTGSMGSKDTTPDMWIHWVSTYFVDPENWIGQMYDSQFHGTWKASSWYTNAKVDELLRKARTSTDQAARQADYEDASRIVVDEAADIWIYNTIQMRGMSDKVKGYNFSPVGSGAEFRTLSLTD